MPSQVVHVLRFGLIKCSISRRQTSVGERHSISLVRLFRNGDKWQESSRFGRDDLPLVAKLADLAHTWIYLKSQNPKAERPSSAEVEDE